MRRPWLAAAVAVGNVIAAHAIHARLVGCVDAWPLSENPYRVGGKVGKVAQKQLDESVRNATRFIEEPRP